MGIAGKLMSENQLVSHFSRNEAPVISKYRHGLVVPGDLFTVIEERSQGVVTDSTSIHRSVCGCMDTPCTLTREGKLYMYAARGAFFNPVVGSFHSRIPHEKELGLA